MLKVIVLCFYVTVFPLSVILSQTLRQFKRNDALASCYSFQVLPFYVTNWMFNTIGLHYPVTTTSAKRDGIMEYNVGLLKVFCSCSNMKIMCESSRLAQFYFLGWQRCSSRITFGAEHLKDQTKPIFIENPVSALLTTSPPKHLSRIWEEGQKQTRLHRLLPSKVLLPSSNRVAHLHSKGTSRLPSIPVDHGKACTWQHTTDRHLFDPCLHYWFETDWTWQDPLTEAQPSVGNPIFQKGFHVRIDFCVEPCRWPAPCVFFSAEQRRALGLLVQCFH